MTKKYQTNFVNNFKSSIVVIFALSLLIAINFYFRNHQYYDLYIFLYSIALILPLLGPAVYLHVEYFIRNREAILEVDEANKKIWYKDEKIEIVAGFDEITQLIKHQVKERAMLFGFYEYYEIHLKSGEILIITNLMARKLSIPGIDTETVKRYIPSIYFSKCNFFKLSDG